MSEQGKSAGYELMSGGKFEFDDGGYYVGEWLDGQAHGKGVCTGPECRGRFAGLWSNGFEVSGQYSWPDGSVYRGDWQDGNRHGYGVERHGKITYRGEWLNGLKHGYGVTKREPDDKVCFEGTWKFGLQDGYGVEIYANGGEFYLLCWVVLLDENLFAVVCLLCQIQIYFSSKEHTKT